MEWYPIETAPDYKTVLVQHEEDLYPVPAYKVPDMDPSMVYWHRETEGPEDSFYGGDRHGNLYRAPTHWMPLPQPPNITTPST